MTLLMTECRFAYKLSFKSPKCRSHTRHFCLFVRIIRGDGRSCKCSEFKTDLREEGDHVPHTTRKAFRQECVKIRKNFGEY